MFRRCHRLIVRTGLVLLVAGPAARGDAAWEVQARPLVGRYCLDCHSSAKAKGDLDLERLAGAPPGAANAKVWQEVIDQVSLGEMPPKDRPQPTLEERRVLLGAIDVALSAAAAARAGDPGPVLLRRLNNAEYNYSIRDLTGIDALDPAREFPADSAAGEGFMNVGQSLVTSPALLTKYLDAAKEVAAHAVLLPDGIGFSASTSRRDWSEERLRALRAFYGRYTVPGGGSSVNLQGIRFDTRDGGVVPLERYVEAAIALREAERGAEGDSPGDRLGTVARQFEVNRRYLGKIMEALRGDAPSLLLDPIRARWRSAHPGEGEAIVAEIRRWQSVLWRFTTVGHIGKRDGPKAWQVPLDPLADHIDVRHPLTAAAGAGEVRLFLVTGDAGDGHEHDLAVWENPRLVAPGRPDLPLRDVRAVAAAWSEHRRSLVGSAAACLAVAAELKRPVDEETVARLAASRGLSAGILGGWLACLGLVNGTTVAEAYLTNRMESAQGHEFVKGWVGADALSVLANASGEAVRVPGNLKAHGVAVHPAPNRRVQVGWRALESAVLRVDGVIQHAHPECGNGVAWAVELRRGPLRRSLASGTSAGPKPVPFGPLADLAVQPGDVLAVVVAPRDGNHACDLTAVDLRLSDGVRSWDLAEEVSPAILDGNPHADRFGHPAVWQFTSEPDSGGSGWSVPAGCLLDRWLASTDATTRERLAAEIQHLLENGPGNVPGDAPDARFHRQVTALNGPLLGQLVRTWAGAGPGVREGEAAGAGAGAMGVDPGAFGPRPGAAAVRPEDLCVRAPSVVEVRLPAELAAGCDLVATARLHPDAGRDGSVQMQVLDRAPAALALSAGSVREPAGKGTWSDGEQPVGHDAPVLAQTGSAAHRRIEAAFEEFRRLFPAAMCYTKIVPVDEVVTLTLHYREDEPLRRLMLDDGEVAELERLWSELHYVSQDALKLVDAFEQLWQFATQDADPSAFEPLREPIRRQADAFRRQLRETEPEHLKAALAFADRAYRRPLTTAERDGLRELYRVLRKREMSHEEAVRLLLARVLVAPAFVYRAETPPPGPGTGWVSDWELATRLSYFLWSSVPDAALRELADAGRLRDPAVLAVQARRMLRDPRVRRLAREFACAWLHLYDFAEAVEKSERHFPTFGALRPVMGEETERFFEDLFRRDRPVRDILDADHTIVNAALAEHYGIPWTDGAGSGGSGDGWRRVEGAKALGRGGILAQGSTLAHQSGASRTSPILRGNWVAEVLLGEKLPRPPKDVPRLPEDEAAEPLTVRELTERHSSDPRCQGCHRRMDPYGYALEGYDAIGRLRDRDLGGRALDTRVRAMDGTEFAGLDGLRQYLLRERRDDFLRQFCRKLLGYALGRATTLTDRPLLEEMRVALDAGQAGVATAVEAVVRSPQFRGIRGTEYAELE